MWLRSVTFIAAVAFVSLGTLGVTVAQTSAKMYRVGWLSDGTAPSATSQSLGEFQQRLRELGNVEGRNLLIEYRYAGGNPERLPPLATELARVPVDVIVTSGESATFAARRATKAVPIVMTQIGADPVKAGLVASLGRPDGNVTGLAAQTNDLWPKRLELLKQISPKASRLAVLWNPANPGNESCVEVITAAAKTLGLQVLSLEVRDANSLDRAFAELGRESVDGLATCWDSVLLERAGMIADFALKRHVPTLAPLREYVEAGFLVSLGASLADERRRAAYYVDKILKGTKPADLPVERAAVFPLVVNVKAANVLGVTIPPALLLTADDVIR
jgi:putative ABC transport system substrate-binding protein